MSLTWAETDARRPLGRRTVVTLAFVAGVAVGFLAGSPPLDTPSIGESRVPASLDCADEHVISATAFGVDCVLTDALLDAAID